MCNIRCSRIDFGLLTIFFMSITVYLGVSIMAPFFPSEAAKKGVSAAIAGGVFAANAVGQFLMASIAGKILPYIGSRIAFAVGLFILGSSNVAFGLLQYVDDYTAFVTLCFVLRIFEACGSALISTTVYMVLIKKCQNNNLAFNVAVNEACSSIGFAVGPPLGSLFYSIGGFKLPFIVLGCIVLINVPITVFLIQNYTDLRSCENTCEEQQRFTEIEQRPKLTYLKLISTPKVVIAGVVAVTIGTSFGCIASTLELYLHEYKVSSKYVGYIFTFFTVSYTSFSLIAGHFCKNINQFKSMIFGLSLCIFGYLLIPPWPFFLAKGNVINVVIALCLIGSGSALAFLPTLPSILKTIQTSGYAENVHNSSCASGLWNSCYTLGLAIGSYCNASIFEHFGAQLSFTVLSIFCLISLIGICSSFLKCCDVRRLQYIPIDGVNVFNNNALIRESD